MFILLCKLIGFSLELLVFQAQQCQKAEKEILRKNVWVIHITGFRVYLQSTSAHPHTHIYSHAKEGNLPQHTMRSNFNHLFKTYMSSMNLSSLARQSSLLCLRHSGSHVSSLCSMSSLLSPHHLSLTTPINSLCQPFVPPPHLGIDGCTPARAHRHPRRTAEVCPLWGCWRSTWHLGCKGSPQTAPGKNADSVIYSKFMVFHIIVHCLQLPK